MSERGKGGQCSPVAPFCPANEAAAGATGATGIRSAPGGVPPRMATAHGWRCLANLFTLAATHGARCEPRSSAQKRHSLIVRLAITSTQLPPSSSSRLRDLLHFPPSCIKPFDIVSASQHLISLPLHINHEKIATRDPALHSPRGTSSL